MAQFDVFDNPIATARHSYPFVVALQSDAARTSREQLVAPLVPRASMQPVAGRLTPLARIDGIEYVVLIPSMTGVRSRDLTERRRSISAARDELLAAIDYLFFGV